MKRARPGPGGVRVFRRLLLKPRAVEGSGATIATGGAISVSPTELPRAASDHPGVHDIRGGTHRRNGPPDPGATGILDSGSHINAPVERPAKPVRSNRMLDGHSVRSGHMGNNLV
jgi:hypothetical protein